MIQCESFDEAVQHEDLKYTFIKDGSRSVSYHSMLMRYGGNRYATYLICLIRGGRPIHSHRHLSPFLNANYF